MTSFSQVTITDPNELYGRKELIEKLLSLANRHDNVAIIGTRRFGKTCLLKCIETTLRRDDKSTSYPIYFDFKEVGSIIKGTDNVYKYMISILAESLFKDKHFTQEEAIKKVKIIPSDDWTDIYEQLSDISSVKIQGLFTEIISFFAELLEKTILFLIDEYEYLFKYSFDTPVGFMNMRTLSSQKEKPFAFWIAGAVSWDYLCTVTGSGELNVINNTLPLSPIEETAFIEMWKQEIEDIDDVELKTLLQSNVEFAYNNSGGVPYYGKHIGISIIANRVLPNYSILKSYFQEIDNALHLEEKKILNDLAKCPQNIKNSKHIIELENKGLVKHYNNKSYEISIGFYRNYLNASMNDTDRLNQVIPECHTFTKKITDLIEAINNTLSNKKKTLMFELVNDNSSLENDLRTQCFNKEQFADFTSSLYKIYFERTKENGKKGERLPKSYNPKTNSEYSKYVYSEFAKCVDTLRHTFGGGHLTQNFTATNGQYTKAEALEKLVGNKNEPYTAEDFSKLQIEILKRFEIELNKILGEVRKIK
jgi:hypothetical protein